MDAFGHDFRLSYKGSDSYQTYLGSLCTLVLAILICFHLLEILFDYVSEGRVSYNYTQSFFDRIEGDAYNLAENGVEIVVFPLLYNEKYAKWKVYQIEPYKEGYDPTASGNQFNYQ